MKKINSKDDDKEEFKQLLREEVKRSEILPVDEL